MHMYDYMYVIIMVIFNYGTGIHTKYLPPVEFNAHCFFAGLQRAQYNSGDGVFVIFIPTTYDNCVNSEHTLCHFM